MPTIPSEFYQTVPPQGAEGYQQIQANPSEFGGQIGQTLQQTGNLLEQHAVQRQQLANETNVNDIYSNQFSPAFRNLRENFLKLEGKDAESQFPAYEQQANELRNQYRNALPNDMQRKLFDQQATRRVQLELDGMARYAAEQTKKYEWNTYQGAMADLASEAEANYNNLQHLEDVQARLDAKVIDYGSSHGWSPEIYQAQRRVATDKLWQSVITRQAIDDPAGAIQTYQRQNATGRLSGQAQGEIEKYLRPYHETIQAQRAYGMATGGPVASRITSEAAAQGVDPGTALTIWSCEGSVASPETKNPNSGAAGHFQFMPGTWAAMGGTDQDRLDSNRQIELGVKLIAQNSKQLQSNLGRQPQAWEVYLAHQQGIDGAEKLLSADPGANAAQIAGNPKAITLNGGTADMTAGQFLTMIKGYVDRHSLMYDPQGLPTARNIRENYQTGLETVRQLARQEHPGDPTAEDRYVAFYTQHAGQLLQAEHIGDQANMDVINAGLNGPNGVKSWADFQADPKRAQAYASIYAKDPSVWDRVDKAISMNALDMWNPPVSAGTTAVYNELKGMQFTDRQGFADMDLNRYYGALPASRFQELQRDQIAIRKDDAAVTQKHVNLEHAIKVLASTFNEAKALPGSEYSGADPNSAFPGAARKYNLYLGNLTQAIDNWRQNNNGKVPGDFDLLKIGREMLMPGQTEQAQASSRDQSKPAQESPTAKYEAYLRQNGYPVTPGNIKALQDQDAARAAK